MSDQTIDSTHLRALMLEHLHVEVPSADADLLETGVLDSLQLVELLLLLEERFGRRIAIEAIDLEDLRTLTRLTQLLNQTGHAAVEPDERRDGLPAGHGASPGG
jgi:acyl carrier protein